MKMCLCGHAADYHDAAIGCLAGDEAGQCSCGQLRPAQGAFQKSKVTARLVHALRMAAEAAYQAEVVDTDMQAMLIGPGNEYADKEDWIVQRMQEWLDTADHEETDGAAA